MDSLTYDGTFHGFLTLVFDRFNESDIPEQIAKSETDSYRLFNTGAFVTTDRKKALRVWRGIEQKSAAAIKAIYFAYLSEHPHIERLLFRYIKSFFHALPKEKELDEKDKDRIYQLANRVAREKQRLEIFTRFEDNKAGIPQAYVAPKYNVLPLLSKHFKSQFGTGPWLIIDTLRNSALSCDGSGLEIQHVFSVQSDTGKTHHARNTGYRRVAKVAV